MRTYGITGTSYSGSTLLSIILGGIDEIFSVGEPINIQRQGGKWCAVCESYCHFWTDEFVELCAKSDSMYDLIIERIEEQFPEKNIMLVGDKTPNVYLNYLDKGFCIDGFIVLFKSLEAFAYSYVHHHPNNNVNDALNGYVDLYRLIENLHPKIIVSYDDFVSNSKVVVKVICDFMKVDFNEEILDYKKHKNKLHMHSGNSGTYMHIWSEEKRKRVLNSKFWKEHWPNYDSSLIETNCGHITPDYRWKAWITEEIKNNIKNHQLAQDTYMNLMKNKIGV